MVKLIKGGHGRFRSQGIWHYWIEGIKEDAEQEGYWDQQSSDFNAENPFYESGQEFVVMAGLPGNFSRATFMIIGVKKISVREPTIDNPSPGYFKRPVVCRLSEWVHYTMDSKPTIVPVEPKPIYIKADGEVKWNPGKKEHEVLVDGAVVFSSADKAQALAVASGDRAM